jgi:HYR domain
MKHALSRRLHARRVALAALLATLAATVAAAPTRSQPAASQLDLRGSISFVEDTAAPCPPGSPDTLTCPAVAGEGAVPGLGAVRETLTEALHHGPPLCAEDEVKFLGSPARWVVANKGEIDFAIAPSPACITALANTHTLDQLAFSVTGGTGIYAGASGSGTFSEAGRLSSPGKFRGIHTWTGTLSVPGLEFDTSAPTISGASNKVVKVKRTARRARVSYAVTASDTVDGTVPVTCKPPSGSRFKVGKTRVSCTAMDNSGNSATTQFTVTVRAGR